MCIRDRWNSGLDADKDTARKQKRKLSYYSNIYVVKDQLHPENEGKVFLYKYGKKIHDKIASAMQPQFGWNKTNGGRIFLEAKSCVKSRAYR